MVLENLQTAPLLEWLLGPGWHDAAFFQPRAFWVLLPLALCAVAWLIRLLRRQPMMVSRRAGGAVGIAIAVAAAIGLVAAFFYFAVEHTGHKGAENAQAAAEGPAVGDENEAGRTPLESAIQPLSHLATWALGPQWYEGSLYRWILLLGCVTAAVYAIGWLVGAVRSGPAAATVRSGSVLVEAVLDVVRISPRRVLALAWLAIRESIRRRVVVVFAVFILLLSFGGWFLNPGSDQPARLYLQFVLTATSYLVLMLAWILSALSLPADIKDKTLFTVVTKPVRSTEIVLGRLLGFAAVGTALLASMGIISYFFTVRGLNHTHQLTAADLHEEPRPGSQQPLRKGLTSRVHGHQHEVTIDPSDSAVVEIKQRHWHDVTVEGSGDSAVYTLGPPQGLLVARVPRYGKLHFRDRAGKDVDRGVNVGDEWVYRSFIEGGTKAAAVWTFEGIRDDLFPESMFPDAIPLEMTIEVFRTYKGDVERPILGTLWLRNPQTGQKVAVRNFLAKKFSTDVQWIPRSLPAAGGDGRTRTLDLFRDLVSDDGRLEVALQCLESQQYFGMAQPDVYFRVRDASFATNFAKGYFGIWLQMVLVLGMGIMFSTCLSGPVAMLATLGTAVAGLFSDYMAEVAGGHMLGGGPFESFIRIVTQQNLVTELEQGLSTNAATMGDHVVRGLLWIISSLLPAVDRFDFVDFVAEGFDVGWPLLFTCVFRAAAFLLPVFMAGYLFLKLREVAK